jgi:hypothetical protein
MLASPDPAIRDETAYPILATWVMRGVLDGRLGTLGEELAVRLGHQEIQARTFAALALAPVVVRDLTSAELTTPRVLGWRDAYALWWQGEQDLRGYDAQLGWLHAIAHGADLMRALGRSRHLDRPELVGLLDLAITRLLTPTDYLFGHDEDGRLAYALATVLVRGELDEADATGWIHRIARFLIEGEPGPIPPCVANTVATLRALYPYVERGVAWPDRTAPGGFTVPEQMPHARLIRDALVDTLRVVAPGLG